jgi:ZIP family zinc transporter
MSQSTTALFGAITGLTIFIGLPVARARNIAPRARGLMNSVATGILIFLLWDVLSKANEPVGQALVNLHRGDVAGFAVLAVLFLGGLGAGLLGLVYFNRRMAPFLAAGAKQTPVGPGAAIAVSAPAILTNRSLAMMIAIGLGLHNLSEGLAIGQAAAAGAIAFAGVLVIGFGLHNVTEGFGIAAPMTLDADPPPWRFLALAGIIAGGPAFLGTVAGYSFTSPYAFVFFLTLAAGALIYVINEMFAVNRRQVGAVLVGWGIVIGFAAGYGTDLLLTYSRG